MKIEIAESLTESYLKHFEGCRVVQTNWKTSGKWKITKDEKKRAKSLFDKIKDSNDFSGIFKKSSFEQLIKQAEIDVLGINTTENTIFGIDVAFHTSGINYGNKTDTAKIVLKKIFRTIFILQSYFNEYEKFHSIFVTPKANPANQTLIDELIDKARFLINETNIKIDFISNERFFSEIVDPLVENIADENDTSELFSRALKLIYLDKRKNVSSNKKEEKIKKNRIINDGKKEISGMKIGQFAQHIFRKAYEQNLISPTEIDKLQEVEYSKRMFNMDTEILRNTSRSIKDKNNRNRYYAREIFCDNYRLTSQWTETHWKLFLDWLKEIGYDYSNNAP